VGECQHHCEDRKMFEHFHSTASLNVVFRFNHFFRSGAFKTAPGWFTRTADEGPQIHTATATLPLKIGETWFILEHTF